MNLFKDFSIENKKMILFLFFVFLGIILFFQSCETTQKSLPQKNEPLNIDTVIPAGKVLIPIQIQNLENVSALIGQMGVVDLWTYHQDSLKKSKKIASQIKMIRAPLDPNVFAVLVDDEESREILEYGDQFYVTVHHPKSKKNRVLKKKLATEKVKFETFSNSESL